MNLNKIWHVLTVMSRNKPTLLQACWMHNVKTSGYVAVTKRGSVAFPDHLERPGASGTTRPSAGHQQLTPQGQGPSGGSTPVQRPQNQGPPEIPRQQQSDSIPRHQQAEPPTGSQTKSDKKMILFSPRTR